MKLRKALALGLVLGVTTAAHANFENTDTATIVGGTQVDASNPVASTTVLILGKVPAPPQMQVAKKGAAQDPQEETYICTGSIIDSDLVVTAAHCVAAAAQDIRVVFATDINNGQVDKSAVMPITGYVANPGWQGDNASGVDQHDIAVIHLSAPLPNGYHPANLLSADASDAIKKGDSALLAGFGITNAKTQDGAGTLREVSVKVSKQLGQTEVVLDQRQGKGACHGDSGGPAFANVNGQLQLWGVTNRGYPDNAPDNCKEYAVYTRITAYTDFIEQAANQLRH